jgi:P-type Cu+ transporter
MSSVTLQVENIRCGSCIPRVEFIALSAAPHGCVAAAQLATGLVVLSYPESLDISPHLPDVLRSLTAAGYPSRVQVSDTEAPKQGASEESQVEGTSRSFFKQNKDVVVCCLLMLVSFFANTLCCGPLSSALSGHAVFRLVSFVAAISFALFPARAILRRGLSALIVGGIWQPFSMDTLVSLSVLSQFGVSLYGLISRSFPPRFHEIVLLLGVVKIGRIVEQSMRDLALAQASDITASQPSFCDRLVFSLHEGREAFKVERVSLDSVIPGDILLVKGGDLFPVDGHISDTRRSRAEDPVRELRGPSDGNSDHASSPFKDLPRTIPVDLSVLTGESQHVELSDGDYVPGGALNLRNTPVFVRAVSTGRDSEVALAMESVQRGLAEKSSLQRLADSAAGYLGRVTVGIAVMSCLAFAFVPRMKVLGARYVGTGAPFLVAGAVLASAFVWSRHITIPLFRFGKSCSDCSTGVGSI